MPLNQMFLAILAIILAAVAPHPQSTAPKFSSELIFQPRSISGYPSCHASTLVELPGGELLAAWFGGSQEGASDTAELGARLAPGAHVWSRPAVLADTPGKSDGNAVLHLDRQGRVWIFYVTKENNHRNPQWAQCKLKCRVSTNSGRTFGPERILQDELGWMDRNKPVYLANGVLLLPLYDERDWSSFMFLSRDDGATWSPSETLRGLGGNIQPTVIQRSNGTLFTLMRTGAEHHRLWQSTSNDGRIWTTPVETNLPNPNSGIDMVRLTNGHAVLVFNNSERDRTPLTVALSLDEGRTWPYQRNLETDPGEFSYPALIQSPDGMIHVTYTWKRVSIKHAAFNEEWIRGH